MNQRYKPLALVTFYTETGELVARGTNIDANKFDDDVVSIETKRQMGADAPTFSIVLTRRNPWHKYITPNDKVKIEMMRPPETQKVVFVGLVDDCRKTVTLSGDNPTRTITITGRGMNKALIAFDMGVVPEAEYNESSVGWIVENGITLSGATCDSILTAVWNNIARKFIDYKWTGTASYFDSVGTIFLSRNDMILLDDSNVLNYQGSLWAFCKEIAEEPFYELFWEIIDNVPTLIARPTPFNRGTWSELATYHITDEDVVYEEIGISDLETYTLYSVGAKTLYSSEDQYKTFGKYPVWYPKYYPKYGIRRLHKETAYLAVADAEDIDNVSLMQTLQEDLFNWNIKNNSFLNGNFILKGMAQYTIGSKLQYTSEEDGTTNTFYITGVCQQFTNFGSWTTQLTVTRGCAESDRFTPPFGSSEEYSGSGLTGTFGTPSTNTSSTRTSLLSLLAGHKPSGGVVSSVSGTTNGTHPSEISVSAGQKPSETALKVAELAIHLKDNGVNGKKVVYLFGGPGIESGYADCSQFTSYVFKKVAGIDIGRTCRVQINKGKKVDKANLIAGDLLLFKGTYDTGAGANSASHVGIYIGNNKFIHLGGNDYTGTIKEGDLTTSYYIKHWLTARRIV